MTKKKYTFVLVHGAWSGGWCWRLVANILRDAGHRVYTPTLSGLGERSHLMSSEINLSTHINDIVNLLKWEELEGVVLCGHSYAGMVISGVAEKVSPAIIDVIVYLDAMYTESGKSGSDYFPVADACEELDPGLPCAPASQLGFTGAVAAWIDKLVTPHPVRSFLEPLIHDDAREGIAKKLYVCATQSNIPLFTETADQLAKNPSWQLAYIDSLHHTMIDKPEETAELLLSVAI